MSRTLTSSAAAMLTLMASLARAQSADPAARTRDEAGILLNSAEAHLTAGRPLEGITDAGKATALAPTSPAAWYELGRAYEAAAQHARATFDDQPASAPWRQLIEADTLLAQDQLTDAFVAYRAAIQGLPAMSNVHDSVAQIYERTGHADWAAQERTAASGATVDCERRKAFCQFRAGQYAAAFNTSLQAPDPESRYWCIRAATELARATFAHLDQLPDSAERRIARAATLSSLQRRYPDAILELKAGLKFTPGDPVLLLLLARAEFQARDFEQAIETLSPLVRATPEDPRLLKLVGLSLLELQRLDEAVPALKHALARAPADAEVQLALGRAYLQNGDPTAAVPLLEQRVAADDDGSVHMQLARAYAGAGDRGKASALLERGQTLQRQAAEKRAAAQILPPQK